jgi:NhaC family Na+:H+ antiporter
MGAVLGVSTLSYLPYAIFCIASPALSVLYGIVGFKLTHVDPSPAGELLVGRDPSTTASDGGGP